MPQNDNPQLIPDDKGLQPYDSVSPNILDIVESIEICTWIDFGFFKILIQPTCSVKCHVFVLRTLTIGLRLEKQVWQQKFVVLIGAYLPAILGWDFLSKHHAVLNLKKQHGITLGYEYPYFAQKI